MPDEVRLAQIFRALGDPTRLRIVDILTEGPRCVCEIQASLADVPMNLLSYHLRILRDAGILQANRRGRWVDYRLITAVLAEAADALPRTAKEDASGACGGPQQRGRSQPPARVADFQSLYEVMPS